MPSFKLTEKQTAANALLAGPATHCMMFGGSRSGKTFLAVRAVVMRAVKARRSRHAMMRFRFNSIVSAIVMDTFPRVMELCYPEVDYQINRSQWFARTQNDSEVWFGGLDEKERTEKVLGNEYATIFLNECSQIPWASRNLALTRLAQRATAIVGEVTKPLALKMYYDCNPPDRAHWTYRAFVQGIDPESREPLRNRFDYRAIQMNPRDNLDNLPEGYIATLEGMSARMRRRFLDGEFREATPGALFPEEHLDRWRVIDSPLPDMQRIVVAVDPSGADDVDNAENDAIGLVVAGLGTDGNGYLLEDLTLRAGPASWGKVATNAYDRHRADVIVGEVNYGGAMVKHVIQTARQNTPFRMVTASRGKVVRAEPISSLCELGKVRLVGYFRDLEEELAGFTTSGYVGERSPNRADAMVWAFSELFPGMVSSTEKDYVFGRPPSGGTLFPMGR